MKDQTKLWRKVAANRQSQRRYPCREGKRIGAGLELIQWSAVGCRQLESFPTTHHSNANYLVINKQ